jgi:ABC-type multidrug transport system ATPase subunit
MNLQSQRNEILKQVGAIIEKPDLYKYLSAYENLRLFAKLSQIQLSTTQLMMQLEMVGLSGRAHDKVKTFSQGMKQRLGIAVSLVHDPKLIILDEPTNGLDPQGIADIRNLILHLSREKKKTIFVSSHLLNEIEQVATRVLIIDKGKKIVEGSAYELFDPSQTIVALETLNNSAVLEILRISKWEKYLKSQRDDHVLLKMNRNELPQFHKWLVENNVEVISLQPRHTLEDFFLQVTSGKQHVEAFSN